MFTVVVVVVTTIGRDVFAAHLSPALVMLSDAWRLWTEQFRLRATGRRRSLARVDGVAGNRPTPYDSRRSSQL
jgi:hypothetical protein